MLGDHKLISPFLGASSGNVHVIGNSEASDPSTSGVVVLKSASPKVQQPLSTVTNPHAPSPVVALDEGFQEFISLNPILIGDFGINNRASDVAFWHAGGCVVDWGTRSSPCIIILYFIRALSEDDDFDKTDSVKSNLSLAFWNNKTVVSVEACSPIRVSHNLSDNIPSLECPVVSEAHNRHKRNCHGKKHASIYNIIGPRDLSQVEFSLHDSNIVNRNKVILDQVAQVMNAMQSWGFLFLIRNKTFWHWLLAFWTSSDLFWYWFGFGFHEDHFLKC